MTANQPEITTDGWRTRFSCEDPEAGLYLSSQTPLTVITPPEGEPTVLVDAIAFMEMQKQRDDMRRALGLTNAWRRTPDGPRPTSSDCWPRSAWATRTATSCVA